MLSFFQLAEPNGCMLAATSHRAFHQSPTMSHQAYGTDSNHLVRVALHFSPGVPIVWRDRPKA